MLGHWPVKHSAAWHFPVSGLHTSSVPHTTSQPVGTHAPSRQVSVAPHRTPWQVATQLPPRQNSPPGQVTPLHGLAWQVASRQTWSAAHLGR